MKTVLALLLLATVAVATVLATPVLLKEEIRSVPAGWRSLGRASPSSALELSVLLRQSNLDQLEKTFWAVSDPTNPRYGQHLSLDEVNALVAPTDQHVSQVLHWLRSAGIDTSAGLSRTPNSDMLRVRCTVEQAEALLHTEYFEYSHPERADSAAPLLRAMRYHVPAYLDGIIDVVGPTVRFPSLPTLRQSKGAAHWAQEAKQSLNKAGLRASGAAAPPSCSSTTPACLKSLYSVNDYKASKNTSVGVTGYLEQFIAPSDLAKFFQTFDKDNERTATIVGPNEASNPGTEASLDIQYSMGVAPGVPGTFFYTPGRQPGSSDNEPFLVFLQALSSNKDAPWVISTSYGDDEPTVLRDYAMRVNVEFQKAGVRGLSILFSSGDGGVSGGQPQQCTEFIPTYPAGSPYVTAVGGTTSFDPEVGVSFSSGGFTNYWGQPSYQSDAVAAYINKYGASTLPPAGVWNRTGRGFPDVSAQGTNYPVFVGGSAWPVDGTSCSTPTFSGIVSLLNDVRFAAGKAPLGFLNPLFYQNPTMFTDITAGNNPGCGTDGFTATTGWDPITGLGTPNFEKMSSVIKSLKY